MKKDDFKFKLHIFFGICEGKLFVQFADDDNEIAYAAECPLPNKEPGAIAETLAQLMGPDFKASVVKIPAIIDFQWDGQKIAVSEEKEILECDTVEDLYPGFGELVLSYVKQNGSY